MSGPTIYYVTIKKIALGGAKGDVPFRVAVPARWLMVATCDAGHLNDGLYLHFSPTGKSYTSNGIVLVGNEPWLPLCDVQQAHSKIGMGYKFSSPLPVNTDIFLDIGQDAGGGDYFITLAYSDNVEDWKVLTQG